jgi:cytochrome P450
MAQKEKNRKSVSPNKALELRNSGYDGPLNIEIGAKDTDFAPLAIGILHPDLALEEVGHTDLRNIAEKVVGGSFALSHEFPDQNWKVDRWITDFLVNPGGESVKKRSQIIRELTKANIRKMLGTEGKQSANYVASHHIQRTVAEIFLGDADIFPEEERVEAFDKLLKRVIILTFIAYKTEQAPIVGTLAEKVYTSAADKLRKKIMDAVERSDEASFILQRLHKLYREVDNAGHFKTIEIDGKPVPKDVVKYLRSLTEEDKEQLFKIQVQLVMFAGTETTVAVVSRILMLIANDKHLQEQLISAKLAQKENSKDREYNKLVGHLLHEVSTKWTPIPLTRQVNTDMEVAGMPLFEGDWLTISPDVISDYNGDGAHLLDNFGHIQNPRKCAGKGLAMEETRVAIDELVDGMIDEEVRLEYLHTSEQLNESTGAFTKHPKYDTIKVVPDQKFY